MLADGRADGLWLEPFPGKTVRVRPGDLLFSWSGQPETSIDAFWWRGPDGKYHPSGLVSRIGSEEML